MLARCLCMYVCMYGDVPPPPPLPPARRTAPLPAGRARPPAAADVALPCRQGAQGVRPGAALRRGTSQVPRSAPGGWTRGPCMYGKVPSSPPPLATRTADPGLPAGRARPPAAADLALPAGRAPGSRGFGAGVFYTMFKKKKSIGSQPHAVAWMLRGEGGRAGSRNSVGVRPGN